MKRLRLSWLFIMGILLFPNIIFAEAEHLQFTFRIFCEERDTDCDEEIPEEEDAFLLSGATGKPIKIDLFVENPKREMITAVRAKLKFSSDELLVTDLDTEDSDFTLAAPNENNIDDEEETVVIGRSFTGGSKNSKEFLVATFTLQAFSNGAKFEFLNYQDTELGDTGIFFTSGITTENRLREEPKYLQIGSDENTGVPLPLPSEENPSTDRDILNPPVDNAGIPRPTGLRLQTDEKGNVRLIWPTNEDPIVMGYYLYYSQKSGYYLRRRDVGKTNFALFPNLPSGEKYYFAIKTYNEFDQESDYSNEVFVTIGLPGSESHGFTGNPQEIPKNTQDGKNTKPNIKSENADKTVDSGPEHIFFFLIISIGLGLIRFSFRRK